MKDKLWHFLHKVELSAIVTLLGILLLFSGAVLVTLIAPRFVDPSWVEPTSYYQVQMYEVGDPNLYISSLAKSSKETQFVHHLRKNYTLLAFVESQSTRIVAPVDLERYITRFQDDQTKLTSELLLLRKPDRSEKFDAIDAANRLREALEKVDEKLGKVKINIEILELFRPEGNEAFSVSHTEGVFENFIDKHFVILDEKIHQNYHKDPGVIYVKNPIEYRYRMVNKSGKDEWHYDTEGIALSSLEELRALKLNFMSRKELIELGEDIYRIEGCWYCHSDQTRTLVQDTILNGSESYPAPPSSPNEYIYQRVTFPATRRIGPDLSRVAVKRPGRDWHKGHFWSPKTTSPGSIMPSFRHFFDNDPRGGEPNKMGIPSYKFEAIYQYLMTKGTRITPPTEAWWMGKDPVNTLLIIEGRK